MNIDTIINMTFLHTESTFAHKTLCNDINCDVLAPNVQLLADYDVIKGKSVRNPQ